PASSQALSPWPRRSRLTTRQPPSARTWAVVPQAWRVWPPPCSSSTGGPSRSPRSSPTRRSPPCPSKVISSITGPSHPRPRPVEPTGPVAAPPLGASTPPVEVPFRGARAPSSVTSTVVGAWASAVELAEDALVELGGGQQLGEG